MRRRRLPLRSAWGGALLLLVSTVGLRDAVRAQSASIAPRSVGQDAHSYFDDPDPRRSLAANDPATAQRRQLELRKARFKAMAADAERLRSLAAELHAERAKTAGPYTASELRTLAEIEKLAHRIKDTMRAEAPGDLLDRELFPMPSVLR